MSAPRQPPSALVGRTREIAELDRALDRLAAGGPWSLQIVGEPGIGKSRLLAELHERAQARGFLVLYGRAAEFELDVPFGVLLDAFNAYLGTLEPAFLQSLGAETLGELAAVFPSLAASVDVLPTPRLQTERYRIHYAIRAVLERLAERRPIRRHPRRRAMGRRGFDRDDRARAPSVQRSGHGRVRVPLPARRPRRALRTGAAREPGSNSCRSPKSRRSR